MIVEAPRYDSIKFHGLRISVPPSNGEPIRKGTGMTQTHLDIAVYLQGLRDQFGHESFVKLVHLRERRIQGLIAS